MDAGHPPCFVRLPLLLLPLLCGAAPAAAAPTGGSDVAATGEFWHITDLHLDPTYHLAEDPTKVCYSSKGVPATHAGLFGDFLCDSPYRLIQSAFSHMAPLTRPEDFIVWTGDSPPHVPADELSTDIVIQVISNMTQTIRQHFPNLTVYPALGNHDYWPQDQMPTSTNDIYRAAAQLWKPWLQPEALLTLSQGDVSSSAALKVFLSRFVFCPVPAGGFYSQLVKPGLRVVSLNTILYYGPDKVTRNMTDPAGQFEWLEQTLEKAAQSLEKVWNLSLKPDLVTYRTLNVAFFLLQVYIIAHVPVGYLPFARNTTAIRESHNERLVAICRDYSHVIAGHFYGHTHRDSIMVLLDKQGGHFNMGTYGDWLTSGASLKWTFEELQFNKSVMSSLCSASSLCRLEYIMTEAFGLADLQPRSLLQLGLSFMLPQTKAFDKYFGHYMVGYNSSIVCEGACKVSQVCAVLHLDRLSYSKCVAKGE
ncbi:Acid sphingomyelinase-like phosphodiesterase 3a [Nibea albiflora]|uniref:Acid sphingomyelinase-like phosphodiesterase 3a n=1 Tax=Nibea albiflora TaxID=240163 RepID=A0ACB7FAR6_NIBAL|nr:Acid sphingomyelinase-like phosphodiesterase 3a [Nibea albiflora]